MRSTHFPLRENAAWAYAVTDPIDTRLVTVRLRPPVEIEVEDLATHEVRKEQGWPLEQSDRPAPSFAVEREHGVEIVEERLFGRPERRALVVTSDLRWAGPVSWSHPYWHYVLGTRHYRRAGEEEVFVPAGKFTCLKILVDEGESATVWLAPAVGIVRTVNAIEGLYPQRYSVLELHSFELPDARPAAEPRPASAETSAARPLPTADDIARIMVANMAANQEDPDFMRRQADQDDRLTREVLERHGLLRKRQRSPAEAPVRNCPGCGRAWPEGQVECRQCGGRLT